MGWPPRFCNSGLRSKRSIWLGPPFCMKWTMARAWAGKWPARALRLWAMAGAWAAAEACSFRRYVRARLPKPKPEVWSIWRRVSRWRLSMTVPSADVQEFVGAQEHVAKAGQGLEVRL